MAIKTKDSDLRDAKRALEEAMKQASSSNENKAELLKAKA